MLDLDIFHCLAKEIDCRATLAALCRVSRDCLRIFSPVLYERLLVQDRHFHELEHATTLHPQKTLQTTREFLLSRTSTQYYQQNSPGDAARALCKILENVPNLESLTLAVSLPGVSEFSFYDQVWENINALAGEGELRNLEIIASWDLKRNGIIIPKLTLPNLSKLVIHGIRRISKRHIPRFVNMLLASPHLGTLGLSGDGVEYEDDDDVRFMEEMCIVYAGRRGETQPWLLQLEELVLGNGFQLSLSSYGGNISYLSYMTNLECLRRVRLDNAGKRNELDSRPWLGYDNEQDDIPLSSHEFPHFTQFNDLRLLHPAINLEHISIGYLTLTLIELIDTLRSKNASSRLDSLQIGRYSSIQPPPLALLGAQIDGIPPSLGYVLHQTGHHWRTFDFSDLSLDPNTVLDFIECCSLLESLTCGISNTMLTRFKRSILPGMKHLHTLMITPYYQHQPFAHPVTRIPPEMDIKIDSGKIHSPSDIVYAEPDLPDWKRFDWAKQEKEEEEESQQAIAAELLDISWTAWGNRKDGDRGTKLKFVGLGYRVYTRLWCGFEKSESGWTTVRLPHEKAMEFNSVRTMAFSEDKWAMANRD